MLMKPPTVPANHANAPSHEDLVNTLQLIRHATAPTPEDGGHHEAAHDLEEQRRAFDALPDDYEASHC